MCLSNATHPLSPHENIKQLAQHKKPRGVAQIMITVKAVRKCLTQYWNKLGHGRSVTLVSWSSDAENSQFAGGSFIVNRKL